MSETGIQGFHRLIRQVEQVRIVWAVRNALVSMIPVLTIGAFALILQTLPVPAYQALLETPAGQVAMQFLQLVYSGTFGVLSGYRIVPECHRFRAEVLCLGSSGG